MSHSSASRGPVRLKKLEIIFFVATCAIAFLFHPIFAYSAGWSQSLLGGLAWLVLFGFLAFFFIFAKDIPVPLPYWAIVVSILAGGDLLCPYFRTQGISATPFCLIPYGFPFAFAGAWSVAAAREAWIRADARLVAAHAAVPLALYAALWGGSAMANEHELSQLQREFSAQMRAGTPAAHLLMDADIICPCWTAIAYYPRRLGSRGVIDYVRDIYAGSDCEGTAESILDADFYWVHVDCLNLPTPTPGRPARM